MLILVTRSILRRQGLCNLLRSIPEINTVYAVDNYLDALNLISLREDQVALVLIDNLSMVGSAELGIKLIKDGAPQAHCILLSELPEDGSIARALGAEVVLLEGFSKTNYLNAVHGLKS
jgi:DNA-binding NarL/FixJ family response regulator